MKYRILVIHGKPKVVKGDTARVPQTRSIPPGLSEPPVATGRLAPNHGREMSNRQILKKSIVNLAKDFRDKESYPSQTEIEKSVYKSKMICNNPKKKYKNKLLEDMILNNLSNLDSLNKLVIRPSQPLPHIKYLSRRQTEVRPKLCRWPAQLHEQLPFMSQCGSFFFCEDKKAYERLLVQFCL